VSIELSEYRERQRRLAGALGTWPGPDWERPWLVSSEPLTIQEGMVLAIECAITQAGAGAVAAEQNLIVTGSGAELLTAGLAGRWT
jgi:Xaa-Pro aminopeptidase